MKVKGDYISTFSFICKCSTTPVSLAASHKLDIRYQSKTSECNTCSLQSAKAQLSGDGVKFHCLLHHMVPSLTVGPHVLQTLDVGKVYFCHVCLSFPYVMSVPSLPRLYEDHPHC